jgi:hypothetical protein
MARMTRIQAVLQEPTEETEIGKDQSQLFGSAHPLFRLVQLRYHLDASLF